MTNSNGKSVAKPNVEGTLNPRLSKDHYYMRLAEAVSERANCRGRHVRAWDMTVASSAPVVPELRP